MAAVLVKVFVLSQDRFCSVCGADHRNLHGVVRAGASDPGADCESCRPFFELQVVGRIQEQGQTVQKTVEIPSFDVPVTISDKFQQSKRFELKVPRIQFILRVCELPVVQLRRVPTVQTVQKRQRFRGSGAVLG